MIAKHSALNLSKSQRGCILRVLIALLALVCGMVKGEATKPFMNLPVLRDSRPKFALFSWRTTSGKQQFAVIPTRKGDEDHRFIDKFDRDRTTGIQIATLEKELAKLPRGCLLLWIRDRPHKLDYADPQSVKKIRKMAARLKIYLGFDQTMYESPDV